MFTPRPEYLDDPPADPTPLAELLATIVPAAIRRTWWRRGLAALRRSGDILPIGRGRGCGVKMVRGGGRSGAS
jgi:hypothetical protein